MNLKETQMRIGRKGMIGLVLAIMVIGLASAAVFTHYGTMSGEVQTDSPVYLYNATGDHSDWDIDGPAIPLGGSGVMTFDTGSVLGGEVSYGAFYLKNTGDVDVDVDVDSTDEPGIKITYSVDDGNGAVTHNDPIEPLNVPADSEVLVEVNATFSVYTTPGTYTIVSTVTVPQT